MKTFLSYSEYCEMGGILQVDRLQWGTALNLDWRGLTEPLRNVWNIRVVQSSKMESVNVLLLSVNGIDVNI